MCNHEGPCHRSVSDSERRSSRQDRSARCPAGDSTWDVTDRLFEPRGCRASRRSRRCRSAKVRICNGFGRSDFSTRRSELFIHALASTNVPGADEHVPIDMYGGAVCPLDRSNRSGPVRRFQRFRTSTDRPSRSISTARQSVGPPLPPGDADGSSNAAPDHRLNPASRLPTGDRRRRLEEVSAPRRRGAARWGDLFQGSLPCAREPSSMRRRPASPPGTCHRCRPIPAPRGYVLAEFVGMTGLFRSPGPVTASFCVDLEEPSMVPS